MDHLFIIFRSEMFMWFILLGSIEGEGEFMPRWRAYAMVEGEFVMRF